MFEGLLVRKSFKDKDALKMLRDSEEKMNGIRGKYQDEWANQGAQYTGRMEYTNGWVEEYYFDQRCDSMFLSPGTSLMGKGLMGFAYLVWLVWLFVGIAIISDIFMESIETITSQTTVKETYDP
jgi:hypothetical protein